MTDKDSRPTQPDQGEPNVKPGPTDQGGHGGMATREQEAKDQASSDE